MWVKLNNIVNYFLLHHKFTDQPEIEPGTFRLLVGCFTNMPTELSIQMGKNIDFIIYRSSVTTPFL